MFLGLMSDRLLYSITLPLILNTYVVFVHSITVIHTLDEIVGVIVYEEYNKGFNKVF